MSGEPTISVPNIRHLKIERFRGIEKLTWSPAEGVNIVLGGGDVGKTTVLDAIGLLLSPTTNVTLSDADYFARDISLGFLIEAVMALPASTGVSQQSKPAWPWEWTGKEAKVPDPESPTPITSPAYILRVQGTAEFELLWEVVQPSGDVDGLSVSLRRNIGTVKLSGDDRNDRDLRLVQGSALDRLLADSTLKARLGKKLAETDIQKELKIDSATKMAELDTAFVDQALPSGIQLGLTGGQGLSLNALIGLTAKKGAVQLPLASWGAGTRRLAALEVAEAHHAEHPIILIDEVERGLEPYRQRQLLRTMLARQSQVFLTTHSATALRASKEATVWYADPDGNIGEIAAEQRRHLIRDPEAFLSRLTLVVEGATEEGLLVSLFARALPSASMDLGLWITDADGNEPALSLLEATTDAGLRFGGFVDCETTHSGRWEALKKKLDARLFRWPSGCTEENLIKLVNGPDLEAFITDPADELTGERLRTLAERLGIASKEFADIAAASTDLRQLIIDTASGKVPADKEADPKVAKAYRNHGRCWFKSRKGGQELADKIFTFKLWPKLKPSLMPFLNEVRRIVGHEPLEDLPV